MATLVCASTVFSCGLACVESILADNGIQKTQTQLIAELLHLHPSWQAQPGLMSLADAESIFKNAGLVVVMSLPATFQDVVSQLKEPATAGAILFVTKFWEDPDRRNKLIDLNHFLRVADADGVGVTVMHPYRCPTPARMENYSWQEVVSFQGALGVFKK